MPLLLQLHNSLPESSSFQDAAKLYQFPARIECEHPMADLYK